MRRFSSFRNKGIQLTRQSTHNSGISIRQELDIILKKDYQQIRKNNNTNLLQCGVCSNTPLIMEYIRTVYQDYDIPDPLFEGRQESARETPVFITERRPSLGKELGKSQVSSSHHHQRANSAFTGDFTTPKKQQSTMINTTNRVPITAESPFQNSGERQSILIQNRSEMLVTPKDSLLRESRVFSFSESARKLEMQKIKDSYRYCIACEKPILQANLESHQIQCGDFSQLYKMDVPEILEYLRNRIEKVRFHLKQHSSTLQQQDTESFQKNIDQVLEKSVISLQTGKRNPQFYEHYDRAMSISSKWGKTSQEINKLRWYIRIREHIQSHFGY